jgi:glycine C-acetyltransferase
MQKMFILLPLPCFYCNHKLFMDLFEKLKLNRGPLGSYAKEVHGYFTFPKLEGEIGPRMIFQGKERLNWSLNNYIGLANHPEVRKADADAAAEFGMAYPMGARMMSGNSNYHEQLERELADFEKKEDAILMNFGYQGIMSAIDALVDRHDVIVYDSESHACIIDGVRLHMGKRFVYPHNDMAKILKPNWSVLPSSVSETNGAILVITEGVFGMSGDQGKLKEIVELKKKFQFRLLVDDAHGFRYDGKNWCWRVLRSKIAWTGYRYLFRNICKIDGLVLAHLSLADATSNRISYVTIPVRKSSPKHLPMPLVIGAIKRLELLKKTRPELKDNLWKIVPTHLQSPNCVKRRL